MPRAVSCQIFNISKEEDSTVSLDNPVPYSVTIVIYVFLFNGITFKLCPLTLVLLPDTTEESLALPSRVVPPHIYTYWLDPPSLLFSTLNNSSSLSLSLYVKYSCPFNSSAALLWICSSRSLSSFYWGSQAWPQYSCYVSLRLSRGEGSSPLAC